MIGAAIALLVSWASATQAARSAWDLENSPARSTGDEDTPWAEQGVALPEYPIKDKLLSVPVEIVGSSMEMLIDERSLTVGEDGVVRYVLVLRAQSGAENVFFEGMRCATRELRSYAYGNTASAWQTVDAAWIPIQTLGAGRYRDQLYRYYLCRPAMGALSRDEILRRIRYGVSRND